MPSGFYVCEVCKQEGKEFSVPADEFGAQFMKTHLWDEHKIQAPNTIRRNL